MARCTYCVGSVPELGPKDVHLIITEHGPEQGHDHHFHGPVEDKEKMRHLLIEADAFLGLGLFNGAPAKAMPKEVVFRNKQRIGDMLVFTCAVRDFKAAFPQVRVGIDPKAPHIFDNNPWIDRDVVPFIRKESGKNVDTITIADFPHDTNIVNVGPKWLTNKSNSLDWHMANAFRISIEQAMGIHIPQGRSRPDVWFTREEYDAPRVDERPYWIIVGGGEPGWGIKMYPWEKWQKVVDLCPEILFYQVGNKGDKHMELKGPNVVDYRGRTEDGTSGIRDLFKLFLNAEGSLGLVSFHMHLSGALYKPCVVVAGSRETVSFTRYPGQAYISNDGRLPCAPTEACWACSVKGQDGGPGRCTALLETPDRVQKLTPRCADLIEPEDIAREIRSYYKGGRLKVGTPIGKTPIELVNIAKVPSTFKAHSRVPVMKAAVPGVDVEKRYGMNWGGPNVHQEDWEFWLETIRRCGVKTVLEFKAGLSTLLLNDVPGLKVVTYEVEGQAADRVRKINPKADVRPWDGKVISQLVEFGVVPEPFNNIGMVIVNGPAGGKNRDASTQYASVLSRRVMVYDAVRPDEQAWQAKYLSGYFSGPEIGGRRSALWTKLIPAEVDPAKPACDGLESCEVASREAIAPDFVGTGSPLVRIASTARGWGGAQRSVTTLMRMLLKEGCQVEFLPLHGEVTCREFLQFLSLFPEIKVLPGIGYIGLPCDVLMVYLDDYCWEVGNARNPKFNEAMQDLQAGRKIMMLNFGRGKVGEEPWTRCFDEYVFLNSAQEADLLRVLPLAKTRVLAPCTDLRPFLARPLPDYENGLRIVRHSSQNDAKFPRDAGLEIDRVLSTMLWATIRMMPGPSFVENRDRFQKVPKTGDPVKIAEFLSTGNLFWYSLPEGYTDMGPRVILEAQACGLPVIADPWGGAPDRVTEETGWIMPKQVHTAAMLAAVPDVLRSKGTAARQRARDEYGPEKWLELILGKKLVTA